MPAGEESRGNAAARHGIITPPAQNCPVSSNDHRIVPLRLCHPDLHHSIIDPRQLKLGRDDDDPGMVPAAMALQVLLFTSTFPT